MGPTFQLAGLLDTRRRSIRDGESPRERLSRPSRALICKVPTTDPRETLLCVEA